MANPYLEEKILRAKIYQSTYWKEQCVGLTTMTLVDKAMELKYVGGTFGGNREPTPFICLVMKMFHLDPWKEYVDVFIKSDFKYVRALGAFYLRFTGRDDDVYRGLEPLYSDNRKLKLKLTNGSFTSTHGYEFIDDLLTKDCFCDVRLPPIRKRCILEYIGLLEPINGALEDDFEAEEDKEEDELGAGTNERITTVSEAPQRKETGIEEAMVTNTGIETMTESMEEGVIEIEPGTDIERWTLESINLLAPRKSSLEDDFEKEEDKEEDELGAGTHEMIIIVSEAPQRKETGIEDAMVTNAGLETMTEYGSGV